MKKTDIQSSIENKKPRIFWTKESCLLEALKYKTKTDFKDNSHNAYYACVRNGWLNFACSHMPLRNVKPVLWDLDGCKKEALKYKTRKEYRSCNMSSYNSARKHGWLDEICGHMQSISIKPSGHWTKNMCYIEAQKYDSKISFHKGSISAYGASAKNGWLDEICGHMIQQNHMPDGHWNFDNCLEESKKYNTRMKFGINSPSAYASARRNKWLDDICGHMSICGSKIARYVYSYEFSDNHVYVGLTYNISIRDCAHKSSGSVFDHVNKTGLNPKLIIKTNSPIPAKDAMALEGTILEQYLADGWIKLNKSRTGGLGMNQFWTKDSAFNEALKYTKRSDLYRNCGGAYTLLQRGGFLDEACSHMQKPNKNQFSKK